MPRTVSVHLLPTLFEPAELRGGVAVMIDVLRASTTLVHALAAGADGIVPCETVEQAQAIVTDSPEGSVLSGGERNGMRIPGFHLDNSPFKYTADVVQGKTVVFTTTNGTRALWRSREADRVVIGSFVNLNAVLNALSVDERPVHLVCAGTDGTITLEDVLCAGALASGLNETCESMAELGNDSARIAMACFASHASDREAFDWAMMTSQGGRNLQQLGYHADIERAACWDLFNLVPEFDAEAGSIRSPSPAQPLQKQWLAPPGTGKPKSGDGKKRPESR